MIKYKCSDIVNMALSLADLTNSSFITYADNYKFLNDAYVKLYQKMIDSGEKYFLKTMTITNSGSSTMESYYDLPEDFYQLYSVQITPTCVPISRKSKNEPKSSQRYDIINNQLVIYGNISDNLEVQYYPIPETVTTNGEQVEVSLPTTLSVIQDCNDSEYLFSNSSGQGVIYDADAETSTVLTSYSTGTTVNNYLLGKTTLAPISSMVTSVSMYNRIASANFTFGTGTSAYVLSPFKLNGDVAIIKTYMEPHYNDFNHTDPDYERTLITFCGNNSMASTIDLTIPYATVVASDGNTFMYCNSAGTHYIDSNNVNTLISTISGTSISVYDGVYYIYNSNTNSLYRCDGISFSQVAGPLYSYFGINKVSTDTGYGYTCKSGSGYVVNSIFPNTLLNYPNTCLYTLMSYYLAILYCTKQEKDTTLLETAAARQEDQYFDMLNKDANMNYRITNAYAASSY